MIRSSLYLLMRILGTEQYTFHQEVRSKEIPKTTLKSTSANNQEYLAPVIYQ